MLNKRQEKIIKLLDNSKCWMTGKEIAQLMGVSDRTIRSDIDTINRFYEKTLIESSVKNGYRICQEVLSSLPSEIQSCIPQTPEERCVYIIQKLLFDQKEINLMDLQDQVFISGYTIGNDLKKIRKMIEPYDGLKIHRSKNFISLVGDEQSKRKLYKDLLTKETKGNFLNLNNMVSLYKDFDLLMVKDIFEQSVSKYDISIKDTSMPMLLMHIGVSVQRMLHHNYVEGIKVDEKILNNLEYQVASDFYVELSKHLCIKLVDDEIYSLALLLMGNRSEEYTSDIIEINGKEMSISALIHTMLDEIYETYAIDFRTDFDLITGLKMHLRSLINRKLYGTEAQNVYLPEIKRKYPLIFELGIKAARCLKKQTGLEISENEIGFFSLHFGSAYEKSNTVQKYRVLMVSVNDQALNNYCIQKITSRFKDRMEIIGQVKMFEEEKVKELNPDLILTTLPLKHRLNILTVQVSLFIDNEDESQIFQALNELDKRKSRKEFETKLLDLIRPEFFYANITKEASELISFMCKGLEKAGYIDDSFEKSVFKREKISSTSFNYGFALPHALNMDAKKSCISIAILNEPIEWGEFQVRLVVLLAIKDEDRKLLSTFFDWLSQVVSDSGRMNKLLNVSSYDEFIRQILEG